ncbi:MAG TPA: hypothetical protein VFN39_04085 [Gemmatimonadaceae bacterium]|nr:hypothetical protein [Gemmatimonadaceae bacterium]
MSAVLVAAVLTIAACSGGDSKKATAGVTCRQPKDSATWRAVVAYAKSSDPYAQRFLSAAAGDSALPEVGVAALQDRGPTWLFPGDSAGRTKVRNRLNDGIANTLLVYWHGFQQEGDTAMTIRLSGRYVGGEREGTVARARVYRFKCPEDRWVLTDSTESRSS